jgi:NRPS condensation-like uncharacterized protein
MQEIFQTPTIQGIARYIKENSAEHKHISIRPTEEKDYYELSSAQMRLYFLQQFDLKSTGYNLLLVSRLEGDVDREKLQTVFRQLILRHESLRTSFELVANKPKQRTYRYNQVKFELDYRQLSEAELSNFEKEFVTAFDLSKAPLLRVGLVKTGEKLYVLMINMHHIISDGISQTILIKEFMALYKGENLVPQRIQFKDFSEWQNSRMEIEFIKQQKHYWLQRFAGEIPLLDLPTDFNRPGLKSFQGERLTFMVDRRETRQLQEMADREQVTLYTLLLTVYTVFLYKLTGQEDIVVGTPQAGRRHADLEFLIGMFVNTLAMRNFPKGEKNFKQFLKEVKENTLQAFQNQDYTFEELVKQVIKKADQARNPIFDTVFALQNLDFPEISMPGLKLLPYNFIDNVSKFDLGFFTVERNQRLYVLVEYCTKLFSSGTIERFIRNFNQVLASILENEEVRLKNISISHDLASIESTVTEVGFDL